MKQIKIKVCKSNQETGEQQYLETIKRVPFHKGFLGNFVPHYCRYKNQIFNILGSIDYAYMHGYANDAYINIDK